MIEFLVNGMLPLFSFGLLSAGRLVGLTHALRISGVIAKAGLGFDTTLCFWQYLKLKSYELKKKWPLSYFQPPRYRLLILGNG